MADTAAAPIDTDEPRVLEIRIHGIANAPPEVMLEAERDEITRRTGDDLGSFWSRKDDAPGDGIAAREAYSWGSQARAGGGALAVISRVFVHLGWLFILPFGLCNIAYWTRRIPVPERADAASWDAGRGAAILRVFALVLTLIYVTAFMSVAVDLIGVQCFRGGRMCAALPEWLSGLGDLDRGARAALFSVVPIAAMLVIYLVSRSGRVRYEANVADFSRNFLEGKPQRRPLLATVGFWSMARITSTSEQLHFAGAIGLVLMLLGWDAALSHSASDSSLESAPVATTLAGFAVASPWAIAAVVIGAVVVVSSAVGVLLATSPKDRSRDLAATIAARIVLAVAATSYVAYVAAALITTSSRADEAAADSPVFAGLITTPMVLIVVALGIAYSGAGWVRGVSRWISYPLLAGALVLLAIAELAPDGADGRAPAHVPWLIAGGVACVAAYFAVVWTRRQDLRTVGWSGQGPAVGMLLGLLTSMVISSLLVIGVSAWLSTPTSAGTTEDIWRTPPVPGTEVLDAPDAYERFSVVLAVLALTVALAAGASAIAALSRSPRLTLPPVRGGETDRNLLGAPLPDPRYPGREDREQLTGHARRIVAARRSATLVHRGEALIGLVALLTAIGFLPLVSSDLFDWFRSLAPDAVRVGIRSASAAILGVVALAAVAAVAARAASSAERPLALFWDIVCFFPRAGHPFAPPCYGERAVPELAARTCTWLRDTRDGPRGVILAAHSMGSVLAAATVLALSNEADVATRDVGRDGRARCRVEDVAMLTYGTQLRGFFSRFFPSVLGPQVLGVPGCEGPSLWQADPWRRQVRREWPEVFPPKPRRGRPNPFDADATDVTVARVLGIDGEPVTPIRWRSLWRRTDYLGFPAFGYNSADNPVDRGASERSPVSYLWQVAQHNDYLPTEQYRRARAELVDALREAPAADAAEPTPEPPPAQPQPVG
ncbi:hypothetical protein GE115_09970 [Agromyces sp. CFH 90414]|uniref:Integral membrane protein n=1 Tax=Agromyces agglutinans TaxID=2662258 RepID=A0A6I2F7A9_9MICO|nr:hypothetical protein [Agromyces agglutinans]MRG60191.1 hypothetical protein [Agromyces agglutinans]